MSLPHTFEIKHNGKPASIFLLADVALFTYVHATQRTHNDACKESIQFLPFVCIAGESLGT
jgi:hypothetical protein